MQSISRKVSINKKSNFLHQVYKDRLQKPMSDLMVLNMVQAKAWKFVREDGDVELLEEIFI